MTESGGKPKAIPTKSVLARAFYESDFAWETAREMRRTAWEARPVEPLDVVIGPEAVSANGEEEDVRGKGQETWERLYKTRGEAMFKTRRYMIKAFPELQETLDVSTDLTLMDLGCGAGASLVPILKYFQGACVDHKREMTVLASDISGEAVELLEWSVEKQLMAESSSAVRLETTTWDLTKPIPDESWLNRGDFGTLIFTLSAIHPDYQLESLRNCVTTLKPNGRLLFRDYGAYDMIQERCKKRVGEWTVIKLDGVLCTFYTVDRLSKLFQDAGLALDEPPRYCMVRNVNRKQQSEMLRVFIRAVGRRIA